MTVVFVPPSGLPSDSRKKSLAKNPDVERQDKFRKDPRVPVEFRADDVDYVNSTLDRGHLANSANYRTTQTLNDDTFYFSNMSPQVGIGFNRHYWGRLERSIRDLAKDETVARVFVFTGQIFMPEQAPERGEAPSDNSSNEFTVTYRFIGANHVPVPTHYFKSILAVRDDKNSGGKPRLRLWSYILPNEAIDSDRNIDDFAVTTDYLEHWAGFNLWSNLAADIAGDLESKKIAAWQELPASSVD